MSSSRLGLLCLKSISSHVEFTVNTNWSTTVIGPPYIMAFEVCAEISREEQVLNAGCLSAAGAWCFHTVSLSETLVYSKSFIQKSAGNLRARCGPQLNPRWDVLKCRIALTPKCNFSLFIISELQASRSHATKKTILLHFE